MKISQWLVVSCAVAVAGAARAAVAPAEVIFDHPENFTDVKDSAMPTDRGTAAILGQLRDYLVREAAHFVPEGSRLTITFTDIDLAGEFEPWRGAQFDNIRIIKPIYPPHFKFRYTLTDAAGRVVREGQEDILDQEFQQRITLDRDDPLRYEKEILKDWLRRQARAASATPVAQ